MRLYSILRNLQSVAITALAACSIVSAADAPPTIGDFGPTGLEVYAQKDLSLKIASVMPGSPADGTLEKGQLITAINGKKLPAGLMEQRRFLAGLISEAEATDGKLKFQTKSGEATIQLAVLGAYSETWPIDCPKTDKIIRANADYLTKIARDGKLSEHKMNDGLGILALLSTGEQKDLDVVREIYEQRMKDFEPGSIGSHSWNNGYQGIAVCEYYLRTGDKSVMPLINEICEAARKWQVQGGWVHWAIGVNPQYVGGGLLNAAGTNLLTTLLLAKYCGAEVDEHAMQSALLLFYRFAGHGSNPYGDHRPESGYNSNNGKTEQIAVAMEIACKSENGEIYAMARDKCALSTLYAYSAMLNGHTGAIGNIWYGLSSGLMAEKKPDLYRNRFDQTHWFYELSRRHDGSMEMSGTGRYDDNQYGRATVLGLTAPRKTLQMTGAPRSKYGVPFTLPKQVWGNAADLAFFSIDGGSAYKPLSPIPGIELEKVATASKAELLNCASHPEHVYREATASAIRKNEYYDLIETLLESPDPLARHTACLTLNQYEPWQLRYGTEWRSGKSINPSHFTPRMFNALMKMVRDPNESLWLKDQSLIALVLATPEQILANLDAITPWLEQRDEWWFYESSVMALSPALRTSKGAQLLLPKIGDMLIKNTHTKGRSFVEYMLDRNIGLIPESEHPLVSATLKRVYANTPNQPSPEGEMDLKGISSFLLAGTLDATLVIDPTMTPEMAAISAKRIDDLRDRERGMHIDALISVAKQLDETERKQVGEILTDYYRSSIYQENAEALSPSYDGYTKAFTGPLNKIADIDQLAGKSAGWQLITTNSSETQEWQYASFDPKEKLKLSERERYRQVTFPVAFENWYQPDYKADSNLWTTVTAEIGKSAPLVHRDQPVWRSNPEQGGEVTMIRKTFEVDDLDYALLRLVTYSRQGYRIYLNGHLLAEQKRRSKNWWPKMDYPSKRGDYRKFLKKGTNVLTATSFLQYFKGKHGDLEVYLEGIKELPTAK